ncbi:uncharacterized protein [Cebidichthys violaceus]|uniref:uncharacterized protein n=1 Tax=Cebidichthys violaceus TaxID=271503 RepID=UPI0035CA684D
MINLLSVAILAGFFFASSDQQQTTGPLIPVTVGREQQQTTGPLIPVTEEIEQQQTTGPLIPVTEESGQQQTPGPLRVPLECWTEWFDRDNPGGTGDWETLLHLRNENPGKICPAPAQIQVQTLTGLTVAQTGDVIYRSDTTTGFVCRNRDQRWNRRCNDYRVRFSCPPSFCEDKVCWTQWYDRDNPSGTGDWELLVYLRRSYPGQICDKPLHIEAVTTDTNTPATATGDVIYISSPTKGFACRKRDQRYRVCRDYKVRFGCPC